MLLRWNVTLLLFIVLFGSLPATASEPGQQAFKTSLASRSLLLDGVRCGGGLVAVGERGHILRSEDAGNSWRQVEEVPTKTTLTAVTFYGEKLGWAVGHYAIILRTTDGGNHWEEVFSAPELQQPLLDIWFGDAKRGIAVGAYGYMLVTSDGGDTWKEQALQFDKKQGEDDLPPDWHLNHLTRSATGRFYIAAESGNIYRSDDDGATWKVLSSPYAGSFFHILTLEKDSLLAMGLRGHLLRSDDAGATWSSIETGTQLTLMDGVQLADGRIVLAGLGGAVLTSRDGGHSFVFQQESDRKDISALIDAGNGNVFALGNGGVKLIKSTTEN